MKRFCSTLLLSVVAIAAPAQAFPTQQQIKDFTTSLCQQPPQGDEALAATLADQTYLWQKAGALTRQEVRDSFTSQKILAIVATRMANKCPAQAQQLFGSFEEIPRVN